MRCGGCSRMRRHLVAFISPKEMKTSQVLDLNNRLIQVVQVKDYSSALSISDFKPGSTDGFFARAHRRLATHRDCEVWIASFGPIGPELAGAIAAPGQDRYGVASKLAGKNPTMSIADCENVLGAVTK